MNKLSPKKNWITIKECMLDLSRNKTYNKILMELFEEGKISEVGLQIDESLNLYVGINLNPEMLIYGDTSQESAELKFVSEKIGKYTDFLTKEGILDYVKVDHDRVKTDDYYGYILKISYDFKKYSRKKLTRAIIYFASLLSISIVSILALLMWLI
jgi:hypothetical protein